MSKETVQVPRTGGGPKLRARKIRFEVVDGPDRGLVAELPGESARIGSGKECDICLADPTVSRLHLVVRVEQDRIRVIDAGSRNGTILDGIEIRDAYARADSTITLGATTLRLAMLDDLIELPISSREELGGLKGSSIVMRRLFALLERIAPTDATLLIEGETGTGKELIAEAVHQHSARADGPFVVFDCSAQSETIIHSELFGHARGAFTGAINDRAGLFEIADGGTLFLDEIGELPLKLQPLLLRALERGEIRRMGSNLVRRVDVRVLAATNRSLSREVDAGAFRGDLYYRLAVLRAEVPPLRERLDDIPLLVRHFEQEMSARMGKPAAIPNELIREFATRSWPGNVRELRNAVARALALGSRGPTTAMDPTSPPADAPAIDLTEPLLVGRERVANAYEKAYLEAALAQCGNNVSKAARLAQVDRKSIQRAMKRYGLRDDSE